MIGTCLTDRCGASPIGKEACKAKEIQINIHDSILYQHKDKALAYSI